MQAWRAVDRAYVDKTFNGQSWFKVKPPYVTTFVCLLKSPYLLYTELARQ